MTQPSLLDLPQPRPRKAGHVPRTSVLAALDVDRNGRAAWVTGWLFMDRPLTSAELAQDMNDGRPAPLQLLLDIRRALSDALSLGLVEHAGTRKCTVSGRTCLTWKVRSR